MCGAGGQVGSVLGQRSVEGVAGGEAGERVCSGPIRARFAMETARGGCLGWLMVEARGG